MLFFRGNWSKGFFSPSMPGFLLIRNGFLMFLGSEVFEIQTKNRKTHCRTSLQAGCRTRDFGSDICFSNRSDGIFLFASLLHFVYTFVFLM